MKVLDIPIINVLNFKRASPFTFDTKMRVEIEQFIDGPKKDALDSVVDLRNKIAHGESVGVTYIRIKDYYKRISEIIDFVEAKLS